MLTTPEVIRTLQRKLYTKAKQEPAYRFYALYDKVWRADILRLAYRLVRANKGSSGVDGMSFEAIEQQRGIDTFLSELAQDLKDKTYRPSPVRRVMIPKATGGLRPLGIPTIRDRVAQMAVKLVIEPIFEADFCPTSYGFRPKKSAHDAVDDIADALYQGYTQVIDADLSTYFDSIPHAKLLAVVAERIVDGALLHLVKLWLKAPVIGEDEDGTRKHVGGGKANSKGTPQGGVITPWTQKVTSSSTGKLNWIVRYRPLTYVSRGNIYMTYDTIDACRKDTTFECCPRSDQPGVFPQRGRRDIGQALSSLVAPSLPLPRRGTVPQTPAGSAHPHYSNDDQSAGRRGDETAGLRAIEWPHDRRDSGACGIAIYCSGTRPWLIATSQAAPSIWSTSLTVYWQPNSSASMRCSSPIRHAVSA